MGVKRGSFDGRGFGFEKSIFHFRLDADHRLADDDDVDSFSSLPPHLAQPFGWPDHNLQFLLDQPAVWLQLCCRDRPDKLGRLLRPLASRVHLLQTSFVGPWPFLLSLHPFDSLSLALQSHQILLKIPLRPLLPHPDRFQECTRLLIRSLVTSPFCPA